MANRYKQSDETVEDLQIGQTFILQKKDGFRFGVDGVLLANFIPIRHRNMRMVDLCTGTGIVPIIVAAKNDIHSIEGLEIQEEVADMARRSVLMNSFEDRVRIQQGDVKNVENIYERGAFDCVSVNPPYMPAEKLQSKDCKIAISRFEVKMNLSDVFKAGSYLLREHGYMYVVHRPSRLAEIFECAKKERLEPKVMQLISPTPSKAPNMVLIAFRKGGRPEIKLLPTLSVHNEDGSYTEEIDSIYGRI